MNLSEEDRIRFWQEMEKRAEARREPKGELHVVFCIAGGRFAIRASDCDGVVPYVVPTPIPFIPRHLPGVVFIRGKVYSVTDSAALLGTKQENPWGDYVLVKAGEMETALAVESVTGVMPVESEDLASAHSSWPGARMGLVLGRVKNSLQTIYVLDVERCLVQEL